MAENEQRHKHRDDQAKTRRVFLKRADIEFTGIAANLEAWISASFTSP